MAKSTDASTDAMDLLCRQLSASASFESSEESDGAKKNSRDTSEDKKLLSTPRPRPRRMRSKQLSDISSLLSEPPSPVPTTPGSPLTPDALFLAGRSPQGRHRLRVKQPSDLSGMFGTPPPPLSEDTTKSNKNNDDKPTGDISSVPALEVKGNNRKGRIFGLRKNTI